MARLRWGRMAPRRLALLVPAALCVIAAWPGGAAAAQEDGRLHQQVSIYVLSISDLDLATGEFEVDMYVTFRCNRACDPHFDFRNGSIESSQTRRDEERHKEYRVRAILHEYEVDLRMFPFTRGTLPIEIEDDFLDDHQMVFEMGPGSGLDRRVHLPGFHIDKGLQARVNRNYASIHDTNYSSVLYTVDYRSHLGSVFAKDILPITLLTFAGLLAFLIDPEDTQDRVLVAISCLLALAFVGSALTGRAPHTDYLTFADTYVITSLALLTLGVATLILIYDRRRRRPMEAVRRLSRQIGVGTFILWGCTQVAFLARILSA